MYKIAQFLRHALSEPGYEKFRVPGAQAAIKNLRTGEIQFFFGGRARLAVRGYSALPVHRETLFDVASLTKPLVTAALCARLVERGWLALDYPVKGILPWFPHASVTIRQLLNHTSGVGAWGKLYLALQEKAGANELPTISLAERIEWLDGWLAEQPLLHIPGEKTIYSDIGFLLLGRILETLWTLPLNEIYLRELALPLNITQSKFRAFSFRDEARIDSRCAATEVCGWRKTLLQGQVHDENAWALGGVAGHAGLFADADAVLTLAEWWLTNGLSYSVRRDFLTPAPLSGGGRPLGWDIKERDDSVFGSWSKGSLCHLGFTGSSVLIDLKREVIIVLLTNRIHPDRTLCNPALFRRQFHDAVFADRFL